MLALHRYSASYLLRSISNKNRHAINPGFTKHLIKVHCRFSGLLSWSSHYICGEDIEGEIDRISVFKDSKGPFNSSYSSNDNTGKELQKHEVAFLLVSKAYAPRIFSQAGEYIKRRLNVDHLVGAVVDGVVGLEGNKPHGNASISSGIYLLLGKSDSTIKKNSNGTEWNSTPFYYCSSKVNKLGENSVGRWKTEALTENSKGFISNRASYNNEPEFSLGTKATFDSYDFSKFSSISQPTNAVGIPNELEGLTDHENGIFILASDSECHQYIEAIDKKFPLSQKFGVICASTPFVNGLASTIYHGNKVQSEGIAGIYLQPKKSVGLEFKHPDMIPIGPPMKITRCRGNIILELDDGNATGLLLNQIKKFTGNKIQKDEELYISIEPACEETDGLKKRNNEVYRIESGDPSKGAMAVNSSMDLPLGATVYFCRICNPQPGLDNVDSFDQLNIKVIPTDEHFKPTSVFNGPAIVCEKGFVFGYGAGTATKVVNIPFSKAHMIL